MEYLRHGVAEICLEVEPLAGRLHVAITELRTAKDWAFFIKGMLDERYPQAIKVRFGDGQFEHPHDRFALRKPSRAGGSSSAWPHPALKSTTLP